MLPTIAQHAKSHGIKPNKRLGQNFLYDLSLCAKIAEQAGDIDKKLVVEIGPGVGGLTRAILENNPKHLVVIEKDTRCLSLLEEIKVVHPVLEILNHDALKIDFNDLAKGFKSDKLTILANLPYNIGTTLVVSWLRSYTIIESITVMLQKEVVERMCAQAGSKNYGRLSVWCQLLATPEICFDVAPTAFYPPPKVHSSVVSLIPHNNYNISLDLQQILHQLLVQAFSARRKMIRKPLLYFTDNPERLLQVAGIEPQTRASNITPEGFLALAQQIELNKK